MNTPFAIKNKLNIWYNCIQFKHFCGCNLGKVGEISLYYSLA